MEETESKGNDAKAGVALIICNSHFEIDNERKGGTMDIKRLRDTFQELNFDVIVVEDKSSSQILKVAKRVARRDHSHHDCLVVAISSHGDMDSREARGVEKMEKFEFEEEFEVLLGSDGPYAFSLLTETFDENHAPTLKDKPKLFFIQGCRGHNLLKNVRIPRPPGLTMGERRGDELVQQFSSRLDGLGLNDNGYGGEEENKKEEQEEDDEEEKEGKEGEDDAINFEGGADTLDNDPCISIHKHLPEAVNIVDPRGLIPTVVEDASLPLGIARSDIDDTEPGKVNESYFEGVTASTAAVVEEPSSSCELTVCSTEISTPLTPKQKIVTYRSPVFKDVLAMWSCPPGHYAFHTRDGSPFITFLCKVLKEHHKTTDLLTMLTEVSLKVVTEYEFRCRKPEYKGRKTVPQIDHQLRRKIFLGRSDVDNATLAASQKTT